MAGDVFLLGSHSWRIRRVEQGVVRVVDAEGVHPTIPFWLGEAPARTDELSGEVSGLRRSVDERLAAKDKAGAVTYLVEVCGISAEAGIQLVEYLAAGRAVLGVLPTTDDVVFERFFDETGGMQLVAHTPFGGRVNRGLGLALRKRFCATFDFELQAAANDDAVVLSLGPQHSFPLADAPRMLRSTTVEGVLIQAVLASPMFTARWRWNLTRSLSVLRFRGGRRNPLPIQRMESDDLMAAVFPALAACQENAAAGPVPIPDHVLVRQTVYDCLHEAMDIDGLRQLVGRLETGGVRVHLVETAEPSVLAHEILNGRPYTFLDDAPLEERRTRAVQLRRTLPVDASELGRLDESAIARVREEASPELRDAEELHDLLLSLVLARPLADREDWFEELAGAGRATTASTSRGGLWCAVERRRDVEALVPEATFTPDLAVPAPLAAGPAPDADEAAAAAIRGHLDVSGPVTIDDLAERTALSGGTVRIALGRLEAEGFAIRGSFDPAAGDDEQWCARRLLTRIHSYTRTRLRREIDPVTAQDLMRFLLRWQYVAPGAQRQGRRGVLAVVDQLQGFEVAAGAWEEAVFPARVEGYLAPWLEDLCRSGELAWGRLSVRSQESEASPRRGAATPSRATPITFAVREDLPWLLQAARGDVEPAEPAHGAAREVLEALEARGALFHSELRTLTRRLPIEVEEGLWDLVSRGLVTADGFQAVRSLLSAREMWRRRQQGGGSRGRQRALGRRRASSWREGGEGRWALLPDAAAVDDPDALAETVAEQLLARWGVVFWDLMVRENLALPWREVIWALRRMEARGLIRGGRFVSGFVGEQYALPDAVEELRRVRRSSRSGEVVRISAADPLNLVGIVVPGARVPAVRSNSVVYRDGLPVDPGLAAGAPHVRRSRGSVQVGDG
jgi:ATP-dependent Lhr-like helicase